MRCERFLPALCLLALALPAAAGAAEPDVHVTEAWIRWLPGSLPAGGYLSVRNDGARPVALTGITSPIYGMSMLHRSRQEGAVSRMEGVDRIELPPHQTLKFAAQGYHVMLEQPVHPVHPGDRVPVTLHFADGTTIDAVCEVRSAADAGGK